MIACFKLKIILKCILQTETFDLLGSFYTRQVFFIASVLLSLPIIEPSARYRVKSTLNNENIGLFVLCTETSFPLTNCDKSSHVDRRIQFQQKVVFCLKQVMLVDGRTSQISFKYCLLKGICNGFFSHISVNTF